jgi:hypothetical protein
MDSIKPVMNRTTSFARIGIGALALLCTSACGGADDTMLEGEDAFDATEQEALRGRRVQSPRLPAGVSQGTQTSTGSTGTSTATGAGWSVDPVTGLIIPPPMDPNVDPNSGVNFNDLSNAAVDTGGQCPNNSLMSGPCPAYGIQCVVQQASVTRYCTCLSVNSQGIQGWECR